LPGFDEIPPERNLRLGFLSEQAGKRAGKSIQASRPAESGEQATNKIDLFDEIPSRPLAGHGLEIES
jgi:hypothetical protein